MVSSRSYPSLERKSGGPDNWVEAVGGLPDFIERVAKHLHYEEGMTISRAIATAVSQCKKNCAKGNEKACKAIAQWEAKKARSRAKSGSKVKLTDLEFAVQIEKAIELVFAPSTQTSRFDETKHVRSPLNGQFSEKFSPAEILAVRRVIEGNITNLAVGQTYNLPGNVGWVQRTAGGYVVQGPAGMRIVTNILSDAIVAAAKIVAGKIQEVKEVGETQK